MPVARAGRRAARAAAAVLLAVALVVGCRIAGVLLRRHGADPIHLGDTYPVAGNWRGMVTPWVAVPILGSFLALWGWPKLVRALPFRWLVAASVPVAAGWAVALSLVDGPHGLTDPLAPPEQYPHDVPRVTDLGSYLRTFNQYVVHTGHGPQWTTHVGGHPPGALGVFVLLDRIGLTGLGWAAALCVLGGALAGAAVLATVRLLGGEALARRGALFVPLAPAALWIATSADALFAGVATAGVCALAHAAARTGRRRDLLAVLGGLALGCGLFLSYGLALYLVPALAVVLVQRRRRGTGLAGLLRPLLIGGAVVLALLALAYLAGFDWFEGLRLAAQRTRQGQVWQDRPTAYFVFANLAALAVAVGPATVAGLALLRRHAVAVLPAAVAVAVLAALASDLSKGEVERIYLPFAAWLLPFAGLLAAPDGLAVPGRPDKTGELAAGTVRGGTESGWRPAAIGWLAAQLDWAVLVAATVRTWW